MARKKRLSAEETRQRLIDAGVDLLIVNGIDVTLNGVTLEHAVVDADVPRSSAYAAFSTSDDYSPQELFQRQVILQAVEDRRATIDSLQTTAFGIIAELGDKVSRAELLSELCRVTATENARDTAHSRSWQLVIALRVLLVENPTPNDIELAAWIAESEAHYRRETIRDIYRPLGDALGLRPKAEYGDAAYDYVEIASSAMTEGLAPRYFLRTDELLEDIDRNGSPWSLFAIMFEQTVYTFFEPVDPEAWYAPPV